MQGLGKEGNKSNAGLTGQAGPAPGWSRYNIAAKETQTKNDRHDANGTDTHSEARMKRRDQQGKRRSTKKEASILLFQAPCTRKH